MFTSIRDLIPKSLKKRGLYDVVDSALQLKYVQTFYINNETRFSIQPVKLKSGTIYIEVPSMLLAQEIRHLEEACKYYMQQYQCEIKKFRYLPISDRDTYV